MKDIVKKRNTRSKITRHQYMNAKAINKKIFKTKF